MRQKAVSAGVQAQIAGDSFNSLVLSTLRVRDMRRAEPTVPVHPWLAPKLGYIKGFMHCSEAEVYRSRMQRKNGHGDRKIHA